jgi:chromosome segregation ATPase
MNAKGDVNEQRKDVNDAERDVNKQQGELRDAERDFAKERDEFVSKAQAKLSQLDARVGALRDDYRAGASRLKADTRKDLGELMEKIDTQRAKVKTAFDAASSGAKDRWNDLSKNTGEALDDLENSIDDAHDKLKDAGVKVRDESGAILHR